MLLCTVRTQIHAFFSSFSQKYLETSFHYIIAIDAINDQQLQFIYVFSNSALALFLNMQE